MLFSSLKSSLFLLSQLLVAMNQLSISTDLPVLEILYKWNQIVVSFHLTGFFIGIFAKIIHIVLHSYCYSIYCTSFLIVAILWRTLFIHSLVDRHLGCFYLLAFMMMLYGCLCLHFSVDMCLNSLRYYIPWGRIARSCGNSVFSITKKDSCQTVFQNICNILHSHKQCMRVLVSSLLSSTCPFSLL